MTVSRFTHSGIIAKCYNLIVGKVLVSHFPINLCMKEIKNNVTNELPVAAVIANYLENILAKILDVQIQHLSKIDASIMGKTTQALFQHCRTSSLIF